LTELLKKFKVAPFLAHPV